MKIQRIKERCNLCLLCVRDCVSGAWRNINDEPVMAAVDLCNRCGHCVAVCPQSAIYHEGLDYQQIVPNAPDTRNPDIVNAVILGRRSIRQFRQKAVDRETLETILNLASHSPTASNRQNVSYTVITDKAVLTSLARSIFGLSRRMYLFTRKGIGRAVYAVLKVMDPDNVRRYVDPMDFYIAETEKGRDYILHGAPALILIHGPKKGPFICENCNIAAANIMSLAHAAGLGTCYIGFVTLALKLYPPLQKTARIPKGHKAHAALIIGYPAYRHAFTSSRKTPSIQWIQSYD